MALFLTMNNQGNTIMKHSIEQELITHVIDHLNDVYICCDNDDLDELHHTAFNEDYYIIGYYNAEQWLKKHDVSVFDAISAVIDWERSTLGEVSLSADDINAERIVNLYVYILGEELLSEYDLDELTAQELAEELQAELA